MNQLRKKLLQLDGKGYKAYKSIQGTYHGDDFLMHIDYVQGDPFASPSRIRVEISRDLAKYSDDCLYPLSRKIAFTDFLARETAKGIRSYKTGGRGSGKSGLIHIDAPGQEILARTAVHVDENKIELRLSVGLPARGRTILGKQAVQILCEDIPSITRQTLLQFNRNSLEHQLHLTDQQEAIRSYLDTHGYICFVANGAILPRESGISNQPLKAKHVIPFQSPLSFEVEIPIPHSEPIRGMAIKKGVSLIVGGGYHGKSTLLKAIERGVYNHIRGDGREFVLTSSSAFKVRSEDGRSVEKVNISPFISNLPFGKNTTSFSTDDASGSTSQAANIMECLEIKSNVLLIDEDTSATNFMIRDGRMQELVGKENEPITPFIDKVRQLYHDYGVSTILVIGGSGDYFQVADHVIKMDEYKPADVTERAKKIASTIKNGRNSEGGTKFGEISHRSIVGNSFNAFKGKREKIDTHGLHTISYGIERINLSYIEQLVDSSQTRAISLMMKYLSNHQFNGKRTLSDAVNHLYKEIESKGLEVISPYRGKHPGDLALPRRQELCAAINRLRTLKVM